VNKDTFLHTFEANWLGHITKLWINGASNLIQVFKQKKEGLQRYAALLPSLLFRSNKLELIVCTKVEASCVFTKKK